MLNLIYWFLLAIGVCAMVHEPGYCAMYDNCGKKSVFGASLPCPNNIKAVKPDDESIKILKDICGDLDIDTVCCSYDQVLSLQANLKKVDPLISSCPACRKNFYDFFCEFTCSSNQSIFVNITDTTIAKDTQKEIITELVQYVEPSTASKFFDSCKNLKFSATNGYAMDLIGGGAKNYQQFLKFLGDEKPMLGGSPFQINFAYEENDQMTLRDTPMKDCNDEVYKCACSDCLEACPTLPSFQGLGGFCKVGSIHCFSFATIIVFVCMILALGLFHVYIARNKVSFRDQLRSDYDGINRSNYLIPQENPYTLTAQLSQAHYNLTKNIEDFFGNIAYFCAKFPGFTIGITIFTGILLSLGNFWLVFETKPINLWVSPQETHLKNYQYFEETFGEWFRIEQIIVNAKNGSNVLNWETIQWWFEKELELQEFIIDNETINMEEFCFKPLGESCVIESFTQYFGGYIGYLTPETWESQISNCAESPVNCLPTFQQPLKPNLLFDTNDVLNSKAFVVTILLNNDLKDKKYTERVMKYESALKDWLLDLQTKNPDLNIAFSTEISLTEELNNSSNTDIKIVVISYLLMFLYASISLGGRVPITTNLKTLIHTRFLLGLGGIMIILLSVVSSLGFFALIGLKSTLIIAEVIPFLVLAIGIDNIFLMVHELNKVNASESSTDLTIEDRISLALKSIGPSCFISAILQISMFLLATNVDMPAVKNFAYYSAGAIFINFVLQMTTFISLLSLDQQRLESGRLDIVPWIQSSVELPEEDEEVSHVNLDFSGLIKKFYAPKILTATTKPKILTAFVLWLGVSLSLIPYIELGLDQKIALPRESYLIDYFNSVYKFLNVGPPMFLVVKDLDITQRAGQQKLCGKFSTCEEFSLSNILEQEYKRSDKSTIADPLSNWLDDFFTWLNPNLDECCRLKKNSPLEFCSPTAPDRMCKVCYADHDPPYNISMEGLPEGDDFMFYFNQWIESPSDPCPLGGKAPYGNAISFNDTIISSYFRTSHGPLRSQKDFIVAFQNSLRIVEEINNYQENPLNIFTFSPFYVFFVQYDSIISLTFILLSIALVIIGGVSLILLGSWRSSLILVVTITSIMVNIGGILALWGISLNAVSLVNLVICMGLAVEFCIHITKGYLKAPITLDQSDDEQLFNSFMNQQTKHVPTIKAYNTLVGIGGSVLGGIAITKILGILVLAFTRSKIFEVYYFRMWLSLIVVAVLHSLCLLPILLSYFGDRPKST